MGQFSLGLWLGLSFRHNRLIQYSAQDTIAERYTIEEKHELAIPRIFSKLFDDRPILLLQTPLVEACL